MSHFAEVNENNIVVRVLVVPNEEEHRGQEFLAADLGLGGTWIQTSYNNRIRKQYAGIGYTYDPTNDVFISPKKFPSWVLNSEFDWEPPVAIPDTENAYQWDEDNVQWAVLLETPPIPLQGELNV